MAKDRIAELEASLRKLDVKIIFCSFARESIGKEGLEIVNMVGKFAGQIEELYSKEAKC